MGSLDDALRGETPPIVTPFQDDAVDADSLASLIEYVREGGVDGVFACGTNGEFHSLDTDEHREVIETTVDAAGDLPVLAGVAATHRAEAIERAENAAEAGADAVVATPPFFVTATDGAGNRRFFEDVADAASLPLVLYNIPQHVGECLEVETVAAMAEREDVVALKDSSGDLEFHADAIRETPDDFHVLQGYDPVLLPSLRIGAAGGVNGTGNVLPETLSRLVHAPHEAEATALVDRFEALRDCFGDADFPAATKTALVELGVIEDDEVRPPLVETDDDDRRRIADALDDLDVDGADW